MDIYTECIWEWLKFYMNGEFELNTLTQAANMSIPRRANDFGYDICGWSPVSETQTNAFERLTVPHIMPYIPYLSNMHICFNHIFILHKLSHYVFEQSYQRIVDIAGKREKKAKQRWKFNIMYIIK